MKKINKRTVYLCLPTILIIHDLVRLEKTKQWVGFGYLHSTYPVQISPTISNECKQQLVGTEILFGTIYFVRSQYEEDNDCNQMRVFTLSLDNVRYVECCKYSLVYKLNCNQRT